MRAYEWSAGRGDVARAEAGVERILDSPFYRTRRVLKSKGVS
jgi:hypothetical protein